MILERLTILNYKNIAQADLELSPKVNCFIGLNGEGKTNLLDAIHFLSLCKSATTGQDSLVIRHGEEFMMLEGHYRKEDAAVEVVHCGLKRGQKKVMRRDKKPYKRLAEHIGLVPLILVSPADQMLIAGGSEERRRFMDVVISQYDRNYLECLMRYNKALLQRNALLKMEDAQPDELLLALWEEQMAHEGELIYASRQRYIDEFTPLFQQYYDRISGGREEVRLQYTSHCQRGPLLEIIQRDRAKDLAVGYSLHGVHKDDIEMLLGGFPIKREGSQGQNKSFLIAMKLAQFEFLKRTGSRTAPLLLLDDIFDKLDAGRVEQIVKLVAGDDFGQIFITDTNREHLDRILATAGMDHKLFFVRGGEIDS
ncbi:MAG: DNA replication and repair protein RecF [Bacteroidaceae bacterium]|nr:DNA replication and repair protein RecF [Bacteroidaceae bacterium]